jgi:hypothetical protein
MPYVSCQGPIKPTVHPGACWLRRNLPIFWAPKGHDSRPQGRWPGLRYFAPLGLTWLAQTPQLGVCDLPKGPGEFAGSSDHSLCRGCLRQIADVKGQTSAPARLVHRLAHLIHVSFRPRLTTVALASSLGLHLHQVGRRTCTSKLLSMPSTQRSRYRGRRFAWQGVRPTVPLSRLACIGRCFWLGSCVMNGGYWTVGATGRGASISSLRAS